ncbi:hypothetical protein [Nonomuraea sp. KM90]|uniref:hypothetical protein n=1 Tax=Nonomuraea sp. KM90 TaxID=3457428 RepID=UPI003FCDE572
MEAVTALAHRRTGGDRERDRHEPSHTCPAGPGVDAILMLAAYGELPAADLGRAVGHMVRGEQVELNRITGVLDEVTAAGAHADVWTALAQAVLLLLPGPGVKTRPRLGDLLKVAVRAPVLAGARDCRPGAGGAGGTQGLEPAHP